MFQILEHYRGPRKLPKSTAYCQHWIANCNLKFLNIFKGGPRLILLIQTSSETTEKQKKRLPHQFQISKPLLGKICSFRNKVAFSRSLSTDLIMLARVNMVSVKCHLINSTLQSCNINNNLSTWSYNNKRYIKAILPKKLHKSVQIIHWQNQMSHSAHRMCKFSQARHFGPDRH